MAANNQYSYKLSIITINFNNLSGLKRTVESVVNQNFREFEYIIIDGGSTDGSAEYLAEMKEHFTYYVSEPDSGIYNAMNKGVRATNGYYLLFLNSGDCLANSTVLENVLTEIEIVNRQTDKLNIFLGGTKENGKEHCLNPPETVTLYHLFKMALPHQAMFIPKNLAVKFPFNEEYKVVSDWIQSVEILLSGLASYIKIKSIQIIAINEEFGISSTQFMWLERALYISRNEPLFSVFDNFDYLKKTLKKHNQIISRSVLHRLCWKLMCLTFNN